MTDAIVVYGETSLQQGSSALFPLALSGPLAWEMATAKKDSHALYATFLAGMGYTLASGGTVTLEYLYYGPGYDSNDATKFSRLKRDATDQYVSDSPLAGYGARLLGRAAGNRLDFLRRNHVMLQYTKEDLFPDLDLVSRITVCADDGSSRMYSSLSLGLNDHVEVKVSGLLNTGGPDESFGMFLDYQVQAALEYCY